MGRGSGPAFLLFVNRGKKQTRHVFSQPRITIGRSRIHDPDIPIPDACAAPLHCTIYLDGTRRCHRIKVMGINGLLLNGIMLRDGDDDRALETGDEIRIGDTVLIYEAPAPNGE